MNEEEFIIKCPASLADVNQFVEELFAATDLHREDRGLDIRTMDARVVMTLRIHKFFTDQWSKSDAVIRDQINSRNIEPAEGADLRAGGSGENDVRGVGEKSDIPLPGGRTRHH